MSNIYAIGELDLEKKNYLRLMLYNFYFDLISSTKNMNYISKSMHQDICESKDDDTFSKIRNIEIAKIHVI